MPPRSLSLHKLGFYSIELTNVKGNNRTMPQTFQCPVCFEVLNIVYLQGTIPTPTHGTSTDFPSNTSSQVLHFMVPPTSLARKTQRIMSPSPIVAATSNLLTQVEDLKEKKKTVKPSKRC